MITHIGSKKLKTSIKEDPSKRSNKDNKLRAPDILSEAL